MNHSVHAETCQNTGISKYVWKAMLRSCTEKDLSCLRKS